MFLERSPASSESTETKSGNPSERISARNHGEPADGDGSQHAVPAELPVSARGDRRPRFGREDLPAVPPQTQGVCENHPHQGLQHRED